MDVDALYDDVMQCVYDDVDESKKSGGDDAHPPPAIPIRKRNMSLVDLGWLINTAVTWKFALDGQ